MPPRQIGAEIELLERVVHGTLPNIQALPLAQVDGYRG